MLLVGLGDRLEAERPAGVVDQDRDLRQRLGELGDGVWVGDVEAERAPADLAGDLLDTARGAWRRATTSKPAPASARTVAAPIPLLAPVTSATRLSLIVVTLQRDDGGHVFH